MAGYILAAAAALAAGIGVGLAAAALWRRHRRPCPLCDGTGRVVRMYPDSGPAPWRPGSYAEGVVQPCPARHPKTAPREPRG
jgi:DNA-binding transcriptional LysR family regulator